MEAAAQVPHRHSEPWAAGRAHCVHEQSVACKAGSAVAQLAQAQPAACSAGAGDTAIIVRMPEAQPTQAQAPAACANAPTLLAGRVATHAEHAQDGWCAAPAAHREQAHARLWPLGRATAAGRSPFAATAAGLRAAAAAGRVVETTRCISLPVFVVRVLGLRLNTATPLRRRSGARPLTALVDVRGAFSLDLRSAQSLKALRLSGSQGTHDVNSPAAKRIVDPSS